MPLLYPVTELDANQVLKYVFDEANQRLRVGAEIVASMSGDIEVSIIHTEDSVRLGDGTNFLTSTSLGGKVALDVSLIPSSNPIATTPIIANVAMATAGNEYLYSFSTDTKKVLIKSRKGNIQFAYAVGTSGTNYVSLPFGSSYFIENVNLNGITIYFQSDKSSDTLEVHSFT